MRKSEKVAGRTELSGWFEATPEQVILQAAAGQAAENEYKRRSHRSLRVKNKPENTDDCELAVTHQPSLKDVAGWWENAVARATSLVREHWPEIKAVAQIAHSDKFVILRMFTDEPPLWNFKTPAFESAQEARTRHENPYAKPRAGSATQEAMYLGAVRIADKP